jgi:hypothetical protein
MESKTSLRTSPEVSSLRLNKPYLMIYEGCKFKGSGEADVYNINLSIILFEKEMKPYNLPSAILGLVLRESSLILS